MTVIPQPRIPSTIVAVALLALSGLLAACLDAGKQASVPADSAANGQSESERVVMERSQDRWHKLINGDIESVYQYTSPAYRSLTSLQRFRSQLGGAVEWTDAKVRAADCEADRCKVNVEVTYRVPTHGISHQRSLSEVWILSDNEWWVHTRP